MPQSAQERKCYDTAGGVSMKHDIPFVAIKVVAVARCHSRDRGAVLGLRGPNPEHPGGGGGWGGVKI